MSAEREQEKSRREAVLEGLKELGLDEGSLEEIKFESVEVRETDRNSTNGAAQLD